MRGCCTGLSPANSMPLTPQELQDPVGCLNVLLAAPVPRLGLTRSLSHSYALASLLDMSILTRQ